MRLIENHPVYSEFQFTAFMVVEDSQRNGEYPIAYTGNANGTLTCTTTGTAQEYNAKYPEADIQKRATDKVEVVRVLGFGRTAEAAWKMANDKVSHSAGRTPESEGMK